MGLKVKDYLLMFGMLLTGTINTISKKIQLDLKAPGISGLKNSSLTHDHNFKKPWLQTLFMFIGETICLLGFVIIRYKKQRKEKLMISLGTTPPVSSVTKNSLVNFIFVIPTIFDLMATSISGISLIYIDASVWQMLRGSLIIFTGILSMIFLKRILHLFNWTGMSFTVIGLALVGLSGVMKKNDPGSEGERKVFGVFMVIGGSLITAFQMVFEEGLLKKKGFHPLQVVGSKGVIGSILTGFVVLPILYVIKGTDQGSQENVVDGFYQMKQNPYIILQMVLYIVSIAFYNYFGLSISKNLTALHRVLIDALRTIFVWLINLFIYYAIDKDFGESFDKNFGLLQIDGFAFLLIGTLIYNRIMNLNFIPLCYWEDDINKKISENVINDDLLSNEEEEPLIKTN